MVFFSACISVSAQTVEFAPEVNSHLKINSFLRTYVEVKDDRDAGETEQFMIGPSIQFYLKPLLKLKRITLFDLDDARKRVLILETGYRYLDAPGIPPTNRMQPVMTFHFPLVARILLSDRNRADLDWKNGEFTWRYRNKLALQRTIALHSYHLIPYIAVEPYYLSQYDKWSTTALYAGCLFPVGKHVQFNSYYEHENNTGKSPNQQKSIIGLALNLYFSLDKKMRAR
jgi:hypothetical protein